MIPEAGHKRALLPANEVSRPGGHAELDAHQLCGKYTAWKIITAHDSGSFPMSLAVLLLNLVSSSWPNWVGNNLKPIETYLETN